MDNSDNNDNNMNVGCKSIGLGILSLCVSVFFGLFGSVGLAAGEITSIGLSASSTQRLKEVTATIGLTGFPKGVTVTVNFENKNTKDCKMTVNTTECSGSCSASYTAQGSTETYKPILKFDFKTLPNTKDKACKFKVGAEYTYSGSKITPTGISGEISLKAPMVAFKSEDKTTGRSSGERYSVTFSVKNITGYTAEYIPSTDTTNCKYTSDAISGTDGSEVIVAGKWNGAGQSCSETLNLKDSSGGVIATTSNSYKMAADSASKAASLSVESCSASIESGSAATCTAKIIDTGNNVVTDKIEYNGFVSVSSSSSSSCTLSGDTTFKIGSSKQARAAQKTLSNLKLTSATTSCRLVFSVTQKGGSTFSKEVAVLITQKVINFSAVQLSLCTTSAVASGAARSCTVQATDGSSVLSNKLKYDIDISTSSSNCSVIPTSATIAAESSAKNRKKGITDLKITNSQGGTCALTFKVKQTDSTGSTTEKSTTQDFSVTAAVCTANAVTTDEAKFTEGSSTSVIATRTKTCNAAGTKLTTGNWKLLKN